MYLVISRSHEPHVHESRIHSILSINKYIQIEERITYMSKQKKKVSEDTQVMLFAMKIVGSAVLAGIVAIGMDTYQVIETIGKLYGTAV